MCKKDIKTIILKGRGLVEGLVEGTALVTSQPISFYGGIDPSSGVVTERGHELEGKTVSGKILVFPYGKGSTVGSYIIYHMAKIGTAPLAIINVESEPIIVTGCVLANIPLVDKLNKNPIKTITTGDIVRVDGTTGTVFIFSKA
jgi:hypothetical protein